MAIKLEKIRLGGDSRQLCISAKDGATAYHFWVDRATLKPESDRLYRKGPKDRDVKYLWLSKGIGAKIAPAMLAAIPELLPAFMDSEARKLAAEQAEQETIRKERLTREAAPELLAACEAFVNMAYPLAGQTMSERAFRDIREHQKVAAAAVAKARGQ